MEHRFWFFKVNATRGGYRKLTRRIFCNFKIQKCQACTVKKFATQKCWNLMKIQVLKLCAWNEQQKCIENWGIKIYKYWLEKKLEKILAVLLHLAGWIKKGANRTMGVKRPLWKQRNMLGARIKIMWEEQHKVNSLFYCLVT